MKSFKKKASCLLFLSISNQFLPLAKNFNNVCEAVRFSKSDAQVLCVTQEDIVTAMSEPKVTGRKLKEIKKLVEEKSESFNETVTGIVDVDLPELFGDTGTPSYVSSLKTSFLTMTEELFKGELGKDDYRNNVGGLLSNVLLLLQTPAETPARTAKTKATVWNPSVPRGVLTPEAVERLKIPERVVNDRHFDETAASSFNELIDYLFEAGVNLSEAVIGDDGKEILICNALECSLANIKGGGGLKPGQIQYEKISKIYNTFKILNLDKKNVEIPLSGILPSDFICISDDELYKYESYAQSLFIGMFYSCLKYVQEHQILLETMTDLGSVSSLLSKFAEILSRGRISKYQLNRLILAFEEIHKIHFASHNEDISIPKQGVLAKSDLENLLFFFERDYAFLRWELGLDESRSAICKLGDPSAYISLYGSFILDDKSIFKNVLPVWVFKNADIFNRLLFGIFEAEIELSSRLSNGKTVSENISDFRSKILSKDESLFDCSLTLTRDLDQDRELHTYPVPKSTAFTSFNMKESKSPLCKLFEEVSKLGCQKKPAIIHEIRYKVESEEAKRVNPALWRKEVKKYVLNKDFTVEFVNKLLANENNSAISFPPEIDPADMEEWYVLSSKLLSYIGFPDVPHKRNLNKFFFELIKHVEFSKDVGEDRTTYIFSEEYCELINEKTIMNDEMKEMLIFLRDVIHPRLLSLIRLDACEMNAEPIECKESFPDFLDGTFGFQTVASQIRRFNSLVARINPSSPQYDPQMEAELNVYIEHARELFKELQPGNIYDEELDVLLDKIEEMINDLYAMPVSDSSSLSPLIMTLVDPVPVMTPVPAPSSPFRRVQLAAKRIACENYRLLSESIRVNLNLGDMPCARSIRCEEQDGTNRNYLIYSVPVIFGDYPIFLAESKKFFGAKIRTDIVAFDSRKEADGAVSYFKPTYEIAFQFLDGLSPFLKCRLAQLILDVLTTEYNDNQNPIKILTDRLKHLKTSFPELRELDGIYKKAANQIFVLFSLCEPFNCPVDGGKLLRAFLRHMKEKKGDASFQEVAKLIPQLQPKGMYPYIKLVDARIPNKQFEDRINTLNRSVSFENFGD
ncbi:MAG: hypothetical protein LBK29_02250 [Oscillospiraceae bacterium]|jgi:hypothetical protein|nr:hypothetical protein [Oscillospiraceae bacterium]